MSEYIFLSVLSTSLATSLIVVLLMILSPFINRRYASKWKYWVWILLALRLVIPFRLSDAQEAIGNLSRSLTDGTIQYASDAVNSPQPEVPVRTSQRIMLEFPSGITEPLASPDQSSVRITWLMILEMIWLAGSIVLISVHLCSLLTYKQQVRRKGTRIRNKTVLKLIHDLSDELKIKKSICVVKYSKADSPMILGFIQPVLVLPAEEYSDQELFFILKHELVHYKRHDVCWKLLFMLANAIHWFNPVIWLMQKEAVVDMELSCDERVMQDADYTVKKAYTETLFSTLHKKCTKKTFLSTQFYGGKQVMKKRFRNILSHSRKRSGLFMLICMVVLIVGLGLLIGCSVAESDYGKLSTGEKSHAEGIVMDGVDVPDIVLDHAMELVSAWYTTAQTDFADYEYINWRIELLTHCYTYDDLDGMIVQVYQLNYELLSDKPENVILAGGMSITEDGWVTPDYSNSRFLIFRQEGNSLSYLAYLSENDCYPPDEVFTDDLRSQLESIGIIASSEDEADADESGNTTTLTYIMEGETEEQRATLFSGNGYSIYVPDDDWIQYEPDVWRSTYNEKIRFWITCFENQNMLQVKQELGDSQGMLPDVESVREDELTGQKGDIITRVRLIEQPDTSSVWAVFYCYPEEAIEGAGARLPVIVDTFRATETVRASLWDLIPYSDGNDTNVLEFKNGLRLVLPAEWNGRVVVEKTNHIPEFPEDRLIIYEKNNAEANGRGELLHLDYIIHSIDAVDAPYSIYGENAHNIYRVLGMYRQGNQEYALIYAKYPEDGYDGYINVDPDNPQLQKDYQDLYAFVDEVQIITDHIIGFTECDAADLDWLYIEGAD